MKLITRTKISQNSIVSEFESISQSIGKFHFDINNCISDISKLYDKTEDLSNTKVDVQGMNEVTEGYNIEFGKITKTLEEIEHKIFLLEEYWDKYVPMKIQSSISGTIAPVLSSKKKKLMKSVVSEKIDEIKQSIVTQKEVNIEK